MLEETKAVLLKDVLGKGSEIRVRLKGTSMLPFLKEGETVIVSPAREDTVRAGDVILYYDLNRVICHRLFSKKNGVVMVKGDASVYPEPIRPEKLIGKITALEKNKKTFRVDNFPGRILGLMISRISLITSRIQYRMRKRRTA